MMSMISEDLEEDDATPVAMEFGIENDFEER